MNVYYKLNQKIIYLHLIKYLWKFAIQKLKITYYNLIFKLFKINILKQDILIIDNE